MEDSTSNSTFILLLYALIFLGRFATFAQNPFGDRSAHDSEEHSGPGQSNGEKARTGSMPVGFRRRPLGYTIWALESLSLFWERRLLAHTAKAERILVRVAQEITR